MSSFLNNNFEDFTVMVTRAYKYIQQIKKQKSPFFGVKGTHAMCLYYLGQRPEGYTVTQLASMCCEYKAATSRALNCLIEKGYATYSSFGKKHARRSKIKITEAGIEAKRNMDCVVIDVIKNILKSISKEELDCFCKVFFEINYKLAEYC